jgi:hypothetical protein
MNQLCEQSGDTKLMYLQFVGCTVISISDSES